MHTKKSLYNIKIKIIGVLIFMLFICGCDNLDGRKADTDQNIIQEKNSIEQNTDTKSQYYGEDYNENSYESTKLEEKTDNKEIQSEEENNCISPAEADCMDANEIITVSHEEDEAYFYAKDIDDEIFERIYGKSYKEDSTILREELKYLRILFWGFDGNTHIGELMVNKEISEDILDIFYRLYENKYELESVCLIDDFDADDEKSMESNNTSAFNYRNIAGTNKLSNHSFGMAIDINPLYNPYVKQKSDGTIIISPQNATDYADRTKDFEHKITQEDLCCKLFKEYGFIWGGEYNSLKDYQHFERRISSPPLQMR